MTITSIRPSMNRMATSNGRYGLVLGELRFTQKDKQDVYLYSMKRENFAHHIGSANFSKRKKAPSRKSGGVSISGASPTADAGNPAQENRNPYIGLKELAALFRAAASTDSQTLNRQTLDKISRFIWRYDKWSASGLESHYPEQNRESVNALRYRLAANPALAAKLSKFLTVDGEIFDPVHLSLTLMVKRLNRENVYQLYAEVPDFREYLDSDSFQESLADFDVYQEIHLLESLVAAGRRTVNTFLQQIGLNFPDLYEESARRLIQAEVLKVRHPSHNILSPALPPTSKLEKYHPTKSYLFRPVFLNLGGKYAPFKAYAAAVAVSYAFHYFLHCLIFYPFYGSAMILPNFAICLFFIGTHAFRAFHARASLKEGMKKYKQSFESLNPALPPKWTQQQVEEQIRKEKAEYIKLKKQYFG